MFNVFSLHERSFKLLKGSLCGSLASTANMDGSFTRFPSTH